MLHKWIADFIANVCAGKTNETAAGYRSKLNHLERFLGSDRAVISQDDIDQFRMYLLNRNTKMRGGKEVKGALSKFTIRGVLTITRFFLRWCAEKGYVPDLRMSNIREPKPDPKPVDQLTVDLLLEAAAVTGEPWEQARNTAIVYVLRDTGGRVGAISRIDLDSLNLTDGYATAPDKNDQLAWLRFNAPTVGAIRAWLKIRYQLNPKDYLLWTGHRGHGLSRQGISRMLSRLAAAAGTTGRHNPHSFRHAFARDSIKNGAELGQVADMLGHSSIVVTYKYYARWADKEVKEFHRKYSPGKTLPGIE